MDVAFVKYAEHDVDRDQGSENEVGLIAERILKDLRRSLERAANGSGNTDPVHRGLDRGDGRTERPVRRQIERNGVGDQQALMVHRKRGCALREMGNRGQRNHGLPIGADRRTGGGRSFAGGANRIGREISGGLGVGGGRRCRLSGNDGSRNCIRSLRTAD